MNIRAATADDAERIREVHLEAFGQPEGRLVADCAVSLLNEPHPVKVISLVAIEDNDIVGHVAFSPVFYAGTDDHFGYILAPLAVSPEFQKHKIGSSLVRYGLDAISAMGSFVVFVYGDPQYYSRFGFDTELARKFIPPYTLQYPEGWHALNLNAAVIPGGCHGYLRCCAQRSGTMVGTATFIGMHPGGWTGLSPEVARIRWIAFVSLLCYLEFLERYRSVR